MEPDQGRKISQLVDPPGSMAIRPAGTLNRKEFSPSG